MKLFIYNYQLEEEVDEQGADDAWVYTTIIFHHTQDDAQELFVKEAPNACNYWSEEVTTPQSWWDVWSD